MAGSNTYVEYESDDGNIYIVLANEANSKIIINGGSMRLSKPRSGNYPFLPPNISPRGFYVRQFPNDNVKKFLVCYRRDFLLNYFSLPADSRYLIRDYDTGSNRPEMLFIVSGYKGESHRDLGYSRFANPDTGLIDQSS